MSACATCCARTVANSACPGGGHQISPPRSPDPSAAPSSGAARSP
ncbi:MAG: hypothetical protein JJU09_08805 [Rhodobacteraceae bacterium]|nr:hypothetical protein [Paracoccaceae bacterium]TVR45172.1 MAG: hypothetical protein EA386_12945 [Paracoccaceae bacterium]